MPVVEPNGIVRVFACGRGQDGCSRIGILTYEWGSKPKLIDITVDPILDLGNAGCFDSDGVAYPCLVRSGDRIYMYYAGWMKLGGRVPWVTKMGLAISEDGGQTFTRASRAPILPLTNNDPIGATSAWISAVSSSDWEMYYTKLLPWRMEPSPPRPNYNIWKAKSRDGIHWIAENKNIIPHRDGEYALCAPCPFQFENNQFMFFTARGDRYRLFLAESPNGDDYRRTGAPVHIEPGDWDNEMQCYCHVLTIGGSTFIFYAGNGFGRAGVGYAELL